MYAGITGVSDTKTNQMYMNYLSHTDAEYINNIIKDNENNNNQSNVNTKPANQSNGKN